MRGQKPTQGIELSRAQLIANMRATEDQHVRAHRDAEIDATLAEGRARIEEARALRAGPGDDPYSEVPPPAEPPADEPHANGPRRSWVSRMVSGGTFIYDQPPGIPAVWGERERVIWAEGEALMICGPQGVGKTTLTGQLLRGLIGISDDLVLGLPVADSGKVLYLAMDRPRQISRSLRRTFTDTEREQVEERLVVLKGPPPEDVATNTGHLLNLAEDAEADVVIVDSLKDAALGLSKDDVGAAYNRARQALLNSGRQVLELHHVTKAKRDGPLAIADIYGSTWLTSGAGSVVALDGHPGDPIVTFSHLKQPADDLGRMRLFHDQTTGTMTVEDRVDPVALAAAHGDRGLSARDAAMKLADTLHPTPSDIAKARRQLERLTERGLLTERRGTKGGADGGTPTVWVKAPDRLRPITNSDETPGQDRLRDSEGVDRS